MMDFLGVVAEGFRGGFDVGDGRLRAVFEGCELEGFGEDENEIGGCAEEETGCSWSDETCSNGGRCDDDWSCEAEYKAGDAATGENFGPEHDEAFGHSVFDVRLHDLKRLAGVQILYAEAVDDALTDVVL